MKPRYFLPLIWACLFIHGIWFVLFLYLIWAGPFQNDITWLDRFFLWAGCESCVAAGDTISTAYDMGRLELVSMSLTVLGVVIAAGAFFSFFLVRSSAMNAAEEATEIVQRRLPDIVNSVDAIEAFLKNEQFILTLSAEVLRNVRNAESEAGSESRTEDDAANSIAAAMGGPTDE